MKMLSFLKKRFKKKDKGVSKEHGESSGGGCGSGAYESDLRAGIIPSDMDDRTDGSYLNRVANDMADERDSFKHE